MFRLLSTGFTRAGSGCLGRATRQTAAAASLAAIAVVTLGALSGPATAQNVRDPRNGNGGGGGIFVTPTGGNGGGGGIFVTPHGGTGAGTWTAQPLADLSNRPLRCSVTTLRCSLESHENSLFEENEDEAYVLTFAADLRGSARGKALTSAVYSDLDTGDTVNVRLPFWSLDGAGSPIKSDQDYIFLIAAMESDDFDAHHYIVRRLNDILIPKLQDYKQAGMSRQAIADRLRADMDLVIRAAKSKYEDEDEIVGDIYDLVWSPQLLAAAQAGQAVVMDRLFKSPGTAYKLTFRLE